MSKKNKVNPGQYTQAGRLSPDDAARELRQTASPPGSERSGSGQKAVRADEQHAPPKQAEAEEATARRPTKAR